MLNALSSWRSCAWIFVPAFACAFKGTNWEHSSLNQFFNLMLQKQEEILQQSLQSQEKCTRLRTSALKNSRRITDTLGKVYHKTQNYWLLTPLYKHFHKFSCVIHVRALNSQRSGVKLSQHLGLTLAFSIPSDPKALPLKHSWSTKLCINPDVANLQCLQSPQCKYFTNNKMESE